MIFRSYNGFRMCAALALLMFFLTPATAQDRTRIASTPSPSPAVQPIMPPALGESSPVAVFRKLLEMTPAEQKLALTNRPPETQKRIMAKLREYKSLREPERELRLRATELRWHLQPLMTMPRTNRQSYLERIPTDLRKLVQDRLGLWDLLPPSHQQELLNNELTARYFAQLETGTPNDRANILARLSPERRARLEAGIDQWRGLSEDERTKTLATFNQFFELPMKERMKVLDTISDNERRQMEKTLQAYDKLSAAQREQCLRSFEKFASMTLAERELFLKNAERWKLMSSAERQAWRNLVNLAPLQPPLPPGFRTPPPARNRASLPLATN